jgi:hypothetical protein
MVSIFSCVFWPFEFLLLRKFCLVHLSISLLVHYFGENLVFWVPYTLELIGIGKDFVSGTPAAQQLRDSIDKWDFKKLKASAQQNKWSLNWRDHPQNGRKYLSATHQRKDWVPSWSREIALSRSVSCVSVFSTGGLSIPTHVRVIAILNHKVWRWFVSFFSAIFLVHRAFHYGIQFKVCYGSSSDT